MRKVSVNLVRFTVKAFFLSNQVLLVLKHCLSNSGELASWLASSIKASLTPSLTFCVQTPTATGHGRAEGFGAEQLGPVARRGSAAAAEHPQGAGEGPAVGRARGADPGAAERQSPGCGCGG